MKGNREGNGNLETFPTQSLFIENLKVFSRLFVVVHSSGGEIDFDNMKALFYAVSLTFQLWRMRRRLRTVLNLRRRLSAVFNWHRGLSVVFNLRRRLNAVFRLREFLAFLRVRLLELSLSSLTVKLPWVTKTEFLLTILMLYRAGKWWE